MSFNLGIISRSDIIKMATQVIADFNSSQDQLATIHRQDSTAKVPEHGCEAEAGP